jgi:RNA polymerase sigma-70 factor (ECF subfamily)
MQVAETVMAGRPRTENQMVLGPSGSEQLTQSDEQLWHAFQDGDDAAYTKLYNRYGDRVYAYLRLLLSSSERAQLDDLFQETWIKIFQQRERFQVIAGSTLAGWIFRVAHNATISALRKSRHMGSLDDDELSSEMLQAITVSAAEAFPDGLSTEELMAHVLRVVERLPLMLREVFVLSEIDRVPLDSIAESLAITRTNAKVRLFRARKMIRELLEPVLRGDR